MSDQDNRPSVDEIVERYWPYDGPHSELKLEEAASAVGELLRYMANALWSVRPSGPSLYRVVSRLSRASHGIDEVLEHLQKVAGNLVGDATMYDDRHDRPAAQTAREVAELLTQARAELIPGRKSLEQAAGAACHLGHESRRSRPRGGA